VAVAVLGVEAKAKAKAEVEARARAGAEVEDKVRARAGAGVVKGINLLRCLWMILTMTWITITLEPSTLEFLSWGTALWN
jgi:hypothetical protein